MHHPPKEAPLNFMSTSNKIEFRNQIPFAQGNVEVRSLQKKNPLRIWIRKEKTRRPKVPTDENTRVQKSRDLMNKSTWKLVEVEADMLR